MPVTRFATILMFAACFQTSIAGEKRQHGAHEHGTAKLDVALEQNALHIALDTPAANIIGFEHAPRTEKQKAVVRRGLAQLRDGAALFGIPQAAGCRLLDADVDSPFSAHEQHAAHADKHEHKEHAHEEHAHDKHAHDEHAAGHDDHKHGHAHEHDHAQQEVHADITASWRFDCKRSDAIKRLDVRLFEQFPNMQRLQVQTITTDRQGGTMLRPSNPVLTF